MLIISDVHAAYRALRRVASAGHPLLILGDLVNFVDYRTGDGPVADLFGRQFVDEVVRLRSRSDFEASRALWRSEASRVDFDIRDAIGQKLREQYAACSEALAGAHAYVTYGNVDNPQWLSEALPSGCRFVDGDVVEIEGWRVGFAGGGAPTPLNTPGEVDHSTMTSKLEALGPVDILCTHLPPAVPALTHDVVAGGSQRASEPILEYIRDQRPAYHYFGDVHQPRATRWNIGGTICQNVGYFRATGRAVHHPSRIGQTPAPEGVGDS